jgi:hypothetical protein
MAQLLRSKFVNFELPPGEPAADPPPAHSPSPGVTDPLKGGFIDANGLRFHYVDAAPAEDD